MSHQTTVFATIPLRSTAARRLAHGPHDDARSVVSLGPADRHARRALERLAAAGPVAVSIEPDSAWTDADLPAAVDTVLVGARRGQVTTSLADTFPGRTVILTVTDVEQARAAALHGASGLIAKGNEAGGLVGEMSTYLLIQQLASDPVISVPFWAQGGIGVHTAAAAVIGGASGVVVDAALMLLDELDPTAPLDDLLSRCDGSETTVVDGVRTLSGSTPATQGLPIGQDCALAPVFRDRYRDVAGSVRAVLESITAALAEPTSPHDSVALFDGALPIAQGPMTRVSDVPGFAAAVADGAGVPFIAVSLSTGAQTRRMLTETRALVGDKPWGVGMLGFAPEDVRAAQLEVITEIRPPYAIIAGGRPAQSAELEAVGISTYLHVPSPGLLTQFLAAGARKFIFEGAECGGHTGPRNSFPLWESQLQVLADHVAAHPGGEPVRLLFAGGIHDARSSAMVTAMTAELQAAGVLVGVLMGTSYLFTAEAVATGAIGEVFQERVIAATATATLESAPGHVTRCVASPFADEFTATRRTLTEQGVAPREIWERLENLNVGRLRLAAKGIERIGDRLETVDEQRQLAEGMFMAGGVAALRDAVITIDELHASVTTGADEHLADRRAQFSAQSAPEATPQPAPVDIAIVGMACVFPESPDLQSFWANILAGRDCVTEVPTDRWDPEIFYSAAGRSTDRDVTPSRWGGFLPQIDFDPLSYGIPPSSLGHIDPVQLLALHVADAALRDAGLRTGGDRERMSVIFGAEAGGDLSNATTLRTVLPAYLGELPAEIAAQLPELTEDSFAGILANVIAGRIANRLDLGGANYTVDAACASSLTAVDAACKELVSGTSDVVLCGGADLHNGINDYLLFSSVGALSPSGRSATFDSSGDGIALGEGVGCVVLKRLADAERDGDRVYAVIKGVGSASDGRALGMTAPRPEGQRRALERAYGQAGIAPADVGLIEAHGTGTVVGDKTELATLTTMFIDAGAAVGATSIGSVKSQIGHTKCAAGLAGLIKAAMAIHTGVRPPTLHVSNPNAAWSSATSPFGFHSQPVPWVADTADRVAGVSAFGFGGTNFHVVLSGHADTPAPVATATRWPAELFCFRGVDATTATAAARTLLEKVRAAHADDDAVLAEFAYSAARTADLAGARGQRVHLAVVATDVDDLITKLSAAVEAAGTESLPKGVFSSAGVDLGVEPGAAPTVAEMFCGQGSQTAGMFADLFVTFGDLDPILQAGAHLIDRIYPHDAFDDDSRDAQRRALTDTRTAQPALGMTGLAAHTLLTKAGVIPDMYGGHSYGELAALAAAGLCDIDTLITLSEQRADAMLQSIDADAGTMAAVSGSPDRVADLISGVSDVVVANRNSPSQTVISGSTVGMQAAVEALRAAGLTTRVINVACAFHSPLVAGAGDRFRASLHAASLSKPEGQVWSNRTAAPYGADLAAVIDELGEQLASPVRFVEQIEAMYAAGARVFVEAGPGRVLSSLIGAILGDRPHRTVNFAGAGLSGTAAYLGVLAQLATLGVDISQSWMFHGRRPAPAGKRSRWTVDGQLVRTRGAGPIAGGLVPAQPISLQSAQPMGYSVTSASNGSPAPQYGAPAHFDGAEALVAEFLRSSREMISAQRDVMMQYLGADAGVVYERPAAPAVTGQYVPAAAPAVAAAPVAAAPAAAAVVTEPVVTEAPAPAAESVDVMGMVLEVIADRTGYPVDMIEPDLDLEAELSIDSIKRAEIAGEIAMRLGLSTAGAEVEDVAKARTVAEITALLGGGSDAPATETPAAAQTPAVETPAAAQAAGESTESVAAAPVHSAAADSGDVDARIIPPVRHVQRLHPLDAVSLPDTLSGRTIVVIGSGESVQAVTTRLSALGAQTQVIEPEALAAGEATIADPVDGVLYLAGLDGDATLESPVPQLFSLAKQALALDLTWFLAAGPVAGLHGFFRTVAREYPSVIARVVDLPAGAAAADRADWLIAEMSRPAGVPVVIVEADAADGASITRHGIEMVSQPLGILGSTGAGPSADGHAEATALGLDRSSVVIVVGGAKGIAAHAASVIARASGATLELVGRTELSSELEPPHLAAALDADALRKALIAAGGLTPREIERKVATITGHREIRSTIERLTELGSDVRYRSADMRSTESVSQVIKAIHHEHGRIDGIIYAAGIIEDKLIAEKTAESFDRVFSTKVDGARALLESVDRIERGPRFVVFFGSISAVLGNRGQIDYSSANDALETMGAQWAAGHPERRGLTVHWGPWAPTGVNNGMVTPALMRSYARQGIDLIEPDAGAMSLLGELAWGPTDDTAVVLTASGW
ncbi:type I polyketide synthase [Williamsia sp. CHRR-6]|uniref:type I polyketide synthase n=1 Tax=Williamsia sp. CHRR-6 TaxID=2835871 RepID=UPI001BDA76A8|nr:type I polyketide synthase [Williamsia sp. CHRR-6]MBT0566019.1 SDR family oxidoreductase [Williamsia sp. CHRR-6]